MLLSLALAGGDARSQSPPIVKSTIPCRPSEHQSQEALSKQILAAIQSGHYADAILLVRQSCVSKAESDFAIGELILQGLTDPNAAQRPNASLEDGIASMEKSAMAGHRQAISSLAASFYTGLRNGVTNQFLLPPDEGLNKCWESAKTKPKQAASCVAMRLNAQKTR